MSTDTDRIRMLNDQLRQHQTGGKAVMTPGVAALGSEAVQRLVQTIATFDNFCTSNDPHGEHDFGAFDFDGVEIFFKIDYFDKDLNFHSPDPANPAVTERVITLMLATNIKFFREDRVRTPTFGRPLRKGSPERSERSSFEMSAFRAATKRSNIQMSGFQRLSQVARHTCDHLGICRQSFLR